MKRIATVTLAVLAAASLAGAGVVGSKHDLSSTGPGATTNVNRVCVFCHTPHQSGTNVDPLWNHTLSTVTSYGVYSSSTLNATPTDIGGGSAVSNLCMSCHDGTVAVHSLYNEPNEVGTITLTSGGNVDSNGFMTGTPNLGTDLTNDHPINFTYDTALANADGELVDPATNSTVAGLLFSGTVQCASCHDPHDDTNAPFLVMSNTNSALCTTCHIK